MWGWWQYESYSFLLSFMALKRAVCFEGDTWRYANLHRHVIRVGLSNDLHRTTKEFFSQFCHLVGCVVGVVVVHVPDSLHDCQAKLHIILKGSHAVFLCFLVAFLQSKDLVVK